MAGKLGENLFHAYIIKFRNSFSLLLILLASSSFSDLLRLPSLCHKDNPESTQDSNAGGVFPHPNLSTIKGYNHEKILSFNPQNTHLIRNSFFRANAAKS